ncbi:MAG: VOC family protein [Acidiferrobacter sp.]
MNVTAPAPNVLRLTRIALNVMDLNLSADFYRSALGFVPEGPVTTSDRAQTALLGSAFQSLRMRLGTQCLELTMFDEPGAPYPPESRANDLWFQHFAIVTQDIDVAYRRLENQRAHAITQNGPQQLPAASGGVIAYKFRDPDGHPLELLGFPQSPSQSPVQTPTCGIDHTAISISDTPDSLAFYRDALGLAVTAQQINTGPAQDRLDGLQNVAVEVTTLATAQSGPHLELLAYRQPRGRPRAVNARPTDRDASRIVMCVADLSRLLLAFRRTRLGRVGATTLGVADHDHQALVRDPDGHLLLLEQT